MKITETDTARIINTSNGEINLAKGITYEEKLKNAHQMLNDAVFESQIQQVGGHAASPIIAESDIIPENLKKHVTHQYEDLSIMSFPKSKDSQSSQSVGSTKKFRDGWDDVFGK